MTKHYTITNTRSSLYDEDGIDGPWERAMAKPVSKPPTKTKLCPHCGREWRGVRSGIGEWGWVTHTVCCGREVRS